VLAAALFVAHRLDAANLLLQLLAQLLARVFLELLPVDFLRLAVQVIDQLLAVEEVLLSLFDEFLQFGGVDLKLAHAQVLIDIEGDLGADGLLHLRPQGLAASVDAGRLRVVEKLLFDLRGIAKQLPPFAQFLSIRFALILLDLTVRAAIVVPRFERLKHVSEPAHAVSATTTAGRQGAGREQNYRAKGHLLQSPPKSYVEHVPHVPSLLFLGPSIADKHSY
jgi:hypothetical protein